MKKNYILFNVISAFLILAAGSSIYAQKSNIYVRTGSSGIIKNDMRTNDVSFGGAYTLFRGTFTGDNYTAVVQVKLKLKETESMENLATVSSWEKAYVAFDLPVISDFRLYGGHGYALVQPGSFYSLPEEYVDGTRWGKDGLGFVLDKGFFSWGASFTTNTTSYTIKESFQAGSGITFNLSEYGFPLETGFSLMYDKSKDNEYTPSVFLRLKPNKKISVSAGYVYNASPMTASSSFKRVENYGLSALDECQLGVLISKFSIGSVTVEEEAEGALSDDNDYYSLYLACRLSVPVAEIFTLRPGIMYYSVANIDDSSESRDSLVLYPRALATFGKHTFSLGFQFEHREYSADSYGWIFKLPLYYKYTL